MYMFFVALVEVDASNRDYYRLSSWFSEEPTFTALKNGSIMRWRLLPAYVQEDTYIERPMAKFYGDIKVCLGLRKPEGALIILIDYLV